MRKVKCLPYVRRRARQLWSLPTRSWSLPALCASYNWPKNQPGGGVIAIIELGGGWANADIKQFFSSIGQPEPSIIDVSVDGTENSNLNPQSDADIEVALDIQVAGAAYYLATGKRADIRVYWSQDIASAVRKAANDGCTVCSISWGADEASWGQAAALDMAHAAAYANARGMTVFAAAGDNDSSDGGPNAANVDCPGSCPHVICCGGTSKTAGTETVWNNNPGNADGSGTGGGYSTLFPFQRYQTAAPRQKGLGRMVPDVAANADPDTGYEIVTYGEIQIVGGTSAVAPLYAGFTAALGKRLGFANPLFWKSTGVFTDITEGNNGYYDARVGPDPCSGLGVLNGVALANALTAIRSTFSPSGLP